MGQQSNAAFEVGPWGARTQISMAFAKTAPSPSYCLLRGLAQYVGAFPRKLDVEAPWWANAATAESSSLRFNELTMSSLTIDALADDGSSVDGPAVDGKGVDIDQTS
jgi:hypothetical protein